MNREKILKSAQNTLQIEATSLSAAISNLNDYFVETVNGILNCKGRVVVSGIGKSANVAQKIVATFNSTGTPAVFMHAADAIHGDLGIILPDDFVIVLSNSGNSPEIKSLIPFIKHRGNKICAIVGNTKSYLAENSDFVINSFVEREACSNNLAPTSSTTTQMALGDAIAVCLINERGFSADDFAKSHPGGALGKKLFLKVDEIIEQNEKPQISFGATLQEVIYEITSKRLGATAVLDDNRIVGIITDGDIRRMLENPENIAGLKAADIMGKNPKTIKVGSLAVDAMKLMSEKNITQILVEDEGGNYRGVIHLHDLIREGITE